MINWQSVVSGIFDGKLFTFSLLSHIFFTELIDCLFIELIFVFEIFEYSLPLADQKLTETFLEIVQSNFHSILKAKNIWVDFLLEIQ